VPLRRTASVWYSLDMNLYLIERSHYNYDETYAVVVAAGDKAQAFQLAGETAGDQPASAWHGADVHIVRIGTARKQAEAGVINTSYNAG